MEVINIIKQSLKDLTLVATSKKLQWYQFVKNGFSHRWLKHQKTHWLLHTDIYNVMYKRCNLHTPPDFFRTLIIPQQRPPFSNSRPFSLQPGDAPKTMAPLSNRTYSHLTPTPIHPCTGGANGLWIKLSTHCIGRFRCVLSSQWNAVTVNLRILHCQL